MVDLVWRLIRRRNLNFWENNLIITSPFLLSQFSPPFVSFLFAIWMINDHSPSSLSWWCCCRYSRWALLAGVHAWRARGASRLGTCKWQPAAGGCSCWSGFCWALGPCSWWQGSTPPPGTFSPRKAVNENRETIMIKWSVFNFWLWSMPFNFASTKLLAWWPESFATANYCRKRLKTWDAESNPSDLH